MGDTVGPLREHESRIVKGGPAPEPRPIDPGQLVSRPPVVQQPPWWMYLTEANAAEAVLAGIHAAAVAADIQADIWEGKFETDYCEDKRVPTTSTTTNSVKLPSNFVYLPFG